MRTVSRKHAISQFSLAQVCTKIAVKVTFDESVSVCTVHIKVNMSQRAEPALLWLIYLYGSLMMSFKIIPPPLHLLSSCD